MLAPAAAFALTGCASFYAPYAGADAARLRVKLQSDLIGAFLHVTTNQVTGAGSCGPRILVPRMNTHLPNQAPIPGPTVMAVPQFPREGMHGSTGPEHSGSVELRLAPGHHNFALVGTAGHWRCSIANSMDLQARAQYEMTYFFDGRHCRVGVTHFEPVAAPGRAAGSVGLWKSLPVEPAGPACIDIVKTEPPPALVRP